MSNDYDFRDQTGEDPFSLIKNPLSPERVIEIHETSDVDSSTLSQHHTLGPRHNQASPGDHSHNGATSAPLFHTFSGSGTTDSAGHLVIDTLAPFNTVSAALIQYDQSGRSGGPMCTATWYDVWTTSQHKIGSQWFNGTAVINAGVIYYRGVVFP